jgi:hypothetical protein
LCNVDDFLISGSLLLETSARQMTRPESNNTNLNVKHYIELTAELGD